MTKGVVAALFGLTLVLSSLLGCAGAGLAVREGALAEVVYWFPPGQRYQMIVRIGEDAPPWDRRGGRPTAINLWVHGRGTDWHIVNLLRLPLGPARQPPPETEQTRTSVGGIR
ncbi:MAG TPA: hypothetical protein VNL77_07935 [Roseiflexaceae bacterium]|nr:hypothetical protein [Roseiflexaceae bacterium]